MKKIFLICFAISAIASVSPIIANPSEMQEPDSIGKYVREILGCPGGNNKCFSGKITYKGASIEGTWYID